MSNSPGKTGGPAFPVPDERDSETGCGIVQGSSGMSLRDYFAAAALTGLISSPRPPSPQPAEEEFITAQLYADLSYAIADAMITARATGEA